MKRFLLFSGDHYYPSGGWDDMVGDFDTPEDATAKGQELLRQLKTDWFHVVDMETGECGEDQTR
jgi:hypothetical protein